MPNIQYDKVEKAIRYINENLKTQPNLQEITNAIDLRSSHFQHLLRAWVGITPEQFIQFLAVSYLKKQLKYSSMLDTSYETNFSNEHLKNHCLNNHLVTLKDVKPGQFNNKEQSIKIEYGVSHSPFGLVFIGVTEQRICQLSFINEEDDCEPLDSLRNAWTNADILKNNSHIDAYSKRIFNTHPGSNNKFHLFVKGSDFQVKVWQSLIRIPTGMVFSYQQIANSIALPSGSRAVANAIAKNPIGYLIPCHRVIRNTGVIGGYRWGSERKQAIIAWEAAKAYNFRGENL